jgi:E3 ubiquitin-protein ligase ZNF598
MAASSSSAFATPAQSSIVRGKAGGQSKFPPLNAVNAKTVPGAPGYGSTPGSVTGSSSTNTGYRQPQYKTAWSASASGSIPSSAAASVPTPAIRSVPSSSSINSRGGGGGQAVKLSSSAFPELPKSNVERMKVPIGGNQSLRNILGPQGPAVAAWGSGSGAQGGSEEVVATSVENSNDGEQGGASAGGAGAGAGGKKKGKGKMKQTLFTTSFTPI